MQKVTATALSGNVPFRIGNAELLIPAEDVVRQLMLKLGGKQVNDLPAIGTEIDGGIYSGLVSGYGLDSPDYPIILLPGRFQGKWAEAKEWAKAQGGELPLKREGATVWANLGIAKIGLFEEAWYWMLEENPSGSDYAFIQSFGYGDSGWGRKSGDYRGFAVRRLVL
jgi:hypothetical protein